MGIPLLLCVIALITQTYCQVCSVTFTASTGTISSPLYPRRYPNNQDCTYVIKGPVGTRVTVNFLVFQTESGTTVCDRDYIQIRDGSSQAALSMGTYCGTTVPKVVRSFSNSLYIRFVSNAFIDGVGFQAIYTTSVIPQQYMLIANTGLRSIQRVDMATLSNVVLPLTNVLNPIGVDINPITGRIYWTDVAERTIRSANLDGSGIQLVLNLGPGAVPDGLAVDHLSGLLLYTDAGNRLIGMVTLTGNKYKAIIRTAIDRPRDIEIDKRNGVMYWSDWGVLPKIERANYDGSNRKTLVSGSQYIVWPNALALDIAGGRLYWADAYTDKIGWTLLDGSRTVVTFINPGSHFFGMELFQGNLYITDWGTAGNVATNTFLQLISADGRSGRTIAQSLGRMNDIVIVSEQNIDRGPNGCTVNSGVCGTAICIPNPSNNKKCLTQEPYVQPFPRFRRSVVDAENEAFVFRRFERSAQVAFTDEALVQPIGGNSFNQTAGPSFITSIANLN